MTKLLLIRHSITQGNLMGRYIGCRTDEGLCEEGIALLKKRSYPAADRIYVSPMRRCIETAQQIFSIPKEQMIVVPSLRECDFGDYENKNYQELDGDPDYQAWIDSGGTLPFPHGESMAQFQKRCVEGFAQIVKEITDSGKELRRVACVVHGGTIMAIMEHYGMPRQSYYDYQVKNGCGYLLTPVEGTELWNYQCLQ